MSHYLLQSQVICELRGGKCNAADDRPLPFLHTACTRHCGCAHGTMLNLQDSILSLDTVVNSQSCTYIMLSDSGVMLLCVCVELIITPLRTYRCLMRWRKQIK